MAHVLKLVDNYIVANRDGEPELDYGNSNEYSNRDGFFTLKSSLGGTLKILKTDAVNWENELAVPYTEETMRSFFQINTNFNTASGGSDALDQVLASGNETNGVNIEVSSGDSILMYPNDMGDGISYVQWTGNDRISWDDTGDQVLLIEGNTTGVWTTSGDTTTRVESGLFAIHNDDSSFAPIRFSNAAGANVATLQPNDSIATSVTYNLPLVGGTLALQNSPVVFANMDTATRDALVLQKGLTIFNTTINVLQTYDGTIWQDLF